jgi:hypothetical protein
MKNDCPWKDDKLVQLWEYPTIMTTTDILTSYIHNRTLSAFAIIYLVNMWVMPVIQKTWDKHVLLTSGYESCLHTTHDQKHCRFMELEKVHAMPFLILTEDYRAVLLRRWSSPGIKLSWSPVRPLPHELKTVLFTTDIWLPRLIDQPCSSQLYCPTIESTDQMRLSKIPNVILEPTHDASPWHHHTTEGHQSQPGH